MGGVEMMAHRCKCGGKWRYFLFCRPNSIYCATPVQLNRELKIVLKHNLRLSWGGTARVGFPTDNQKFLDLAPGFKSGSQPTRLLAPPRPSLRWFVGILIFWKHPRIFAPLANDIFRLAICQFRRRHFFFVS